MTDLSTYRNWTIPDEWSDPWYQAFLDLINEIDADINALFNSNIKPVSIVGAATYTVLATDYVILVSYTSTGTVTVTVPSAVIATSGTLFIIKDTGLNASVNNITINTAGSETIDGQTSAIINKDGDSMTLVSNGSNLFHIAH